MSFSRYRAMARDFIPIGVMSILPKPHDALPKSLPPRWSLWFLGSLELQSLPELLIRFFQPACIRSRQA
jgi:hypothetical protein